MPPVATWLAGALLAGAACVSPGPVPALSPAPEGPPGLGSERRVLGPDAAAISPTGHPTTQPVPHEAEVEPAASPDRAGATSPTPPPSPGEPSLPPPGFAGPARAPQAAEATPDAQRTQVEEPVAAEATKPAEQPGAGRSSEDAVAASAAASGEEAPTAAGPARPEPAEGAPDAARELLRNEVGKLLLEFYQAYRERDWERMNDCFWEQATITEVRPLSGHARGEVVVMGAAAFFESLKGSTLVPPRGFGGGLTQQPTFVAAGNLAQAWCRYEASFGGPEEQMRWYRYDAFTFVLHDGRWKIAALAQSFSVPAQ